MRNIKRLVGKDAGRLAAPILLSVLDALFNSFMYGVLLLVMLDLAAGMFTGARLLRYFVAMAVIFVIRCGLQAVSFTMAQCLGPRVSRQLRLTVGNHIRELNLGFFSKNSIGKLNGVLLSDISDYEIIITHSLCDLIKAIAFTVLTVVFACLINWICGLMILLMILISLPLLLLSGRVSGQKTDRLKTAGQTVVSRLVEYVHGIKTFRLYNLTGSRFSRLDDALKSLRGASISSELTVMPLALAFYAVTSMIVPVTLIAGGLLYSNGALTAPALLVLILLSVSLASILGALSSLYPQVRAIARASENICAVLDETPLAGDTAVESIDRFDIRFDQVDFAYEPDVPVLRKVSFEAPQGTTTAIIGPSGSGKTTIVSLLVRFWDVTGGSITVGGVDVRRIPPDVLTRYVSVVFQDVYLLNDTVMNNIRIGCPSATDEAVYEAAKAARCHEFITAMESGYSTMVGEGGSTLSGGEKQRISIARALLKDAPIVLLDETTSNLDADNERDIQRAFDRLMQNKTVLVVAHRLHTIRNADRILVLNRGEIRESGRHEALLAAGGWYAGICREQEAALAWTVQSDSKQVSD